MFRLTSAALVASLSFAALAAEEAFVPSGAPEQVVALNTNSVAVEPALDDYAGVYVAADGATFVVARAADSLAIELPETMALPIRAGAGMGFVLDGSVVEIAFETSGGQTRLIVSRPSAAPVVAIRVPLRRGVVTIQDI
jgi:predicted NBD/HSP70 family sugar kinase